MKWSKEKIKDKKEYFKEKKKSYWKIYRNGC